MIEPKKTRGYLNNNPGNMDRSEPPWNGEIRDVAQCTNDIQRAELTHGRFCVFKDAVHGIRGMTKNLQAYHRAGFNTIEKAINRWAPPNENNTESYKRRVEQQTGKGRSEAFDPNSRTEMRALVEAIICVECAGNPYEGTGAVDEGLTLAGIGN